jgi:predicted DNA-binding protein|tara:strand:- start:368 stop:544 length:177 start_codon:yes stop_codon:yes gene_type:complete
MTERQSFGEVAAKVEVMNERINESFESAEDLFFTCECCREVVRGNYRQLLQHAEACEG